MAIAAARRCLAAYPSYAAMRRWLVAALGQLGKTEEATAMLQEFLAVAPAAFDNSVRNRRPWNRPEDHEHMLDGLPKASWQG
jgi:hypothetical protein